MANQIVVSAGAKVRNLDGVLTGTSGVVNSLPINASNGIPQLDVNGKILVSQLPNSVMEYQGVWNANTNTPTLTNGGAFNQGDVYLCNVAGTTNFGAGPISFIVGDQAIYSGTIWQKAGGATGTVTSVAITESGDSLNITGSPITTSGTINIGFNGTNLQYVNGAGNLTTFPILTGYVPYTGATQAVNLGAYDLTVNELTIGKGTSGLSNNTALGHQALFHITTGNYNTGVGHESLHNTSTGQYNTAIGQSSLFTNTTGSQNTALGLNALLNNTTGGSNVVVGLDAMQHNTTGSSNTALGYNAGSHITGGSTPNTTASNSVYIGRDSKAKVDGGANEIVIGYNAIGNGSNTATFGNTSTTANYFTGSINGGSFVKTGGTSSQFLKADGSVDSSTYYLASNPSYFITLSSLGATSPLVYSSFSGNFSIDKADGFLSGYISATDWTTFNNKQAALSGTGFVKISGTTISYDNSTYYLASNPSAFIALTALSAGVGISYNNTTGVITNSAPDQTVSLTAGSGISVSGTYPSFTIASTITQYTDALARAAISLTTTGTSGASTYNNTTGVFNIPQYQAALTNPVTSSGGWDSNYIPKISGTYTIINSQIFDNGTNVGVGTASPIRKLNVNGSAFFGSDVEVQGLGSTHIVDIVANGTKSPLCLIGGSGNFEIWKDAEPLKAIAIGMAIPGSAISDDLYISTYTGTTWTTRFKIANATGAVTINNLAGTGSRMVVADSAGVLSTQAIPTGTVTGTGTTNYLPKFTGASTIGNSGIYNDATGVGIGTTNPDGTLVLAAGTNGTASTGGYLGFTTGVNNSKVRGAGIETFTTGTGNDHGLRFYTNDAASSPVIRLTLNASGNLGLGVTPSNAYGDSRTFEIGACGILWTEQSPSVYNSMSIGSNFYYNAAGSLLYKNSGVAASRFTQYQGSHIWYTAGVAPSAGAAITFTQAMTLNAVGNLMLGTSTASTGFSRISLVGGEATGIGANTGIQLTYNSSTYGGGAITTINAAGGGLSFYTFTGNVGAESYSQALTLFSTGNLLIQTGGTRTDSGYKLDVNGTGRFIYTGGVPALNVRASDANFALASIFGNQTGDVNWLLMSGYPVAGDFTIRQSDTVNALILKKTTGAATFSSGIATLGYTASASYAALFNGNVGIGTTSPAEKLSVAGAIMSTGGITGHGANRTTISQEGGSGAYWQSYGANTSTVGTFVLRQASSDFSITRTPLIIDTTGAATFTSSVTATSFFESSDSRLKTLIQDNYQTKGIASITPKLYTKNGKVELGYYAQDFVGVLDSAVSKGSDDMLSLSYREVLVAKVYALEQEIKELKGIKFNISTTKLK